jgi:hypothetical protein
MAAICVIDFEFGTGENYICSSVYGAEDGGMVNSEYMVLVLWCLSTRYLLLPWLVISAV